MPEKNMLEWQKMTKEERLAELYRETPNISRGMALILATMHPPGAVVKDFRAGYYHSLASYPGDPSAKVSNKEEAEEVARKKNLTLTWDD